MASKLTAEGRADFARLEKTIKEGLETFVSVGEALAEIKERMLFKDVCSTFESYVQVRWGFSRRHAERQIAAAETVRLIATESGPIGPTPDSEAVVRPLTEIPPEKVPEVWKAAVEKAHGEQPTAKQVAAAAQPHKRIKTAAQQQRAREKKAERKAPEAISAASTDDNTDPAASGGASSAGVGDRREPTGASASESPGAVQDRSKSTQPEEARESVETSASETLDVPPVSTSHSGGMAGLAEYGLGLVILESLAELPSIEDPRTTAGLQPHHRKRFMALSSWAIRMAGKCPNENSQEAA